MMRRMWHSLFTAVAGLVVLAGSASAQSAAPKPFPPVQTVSGQSTPAAAPVAPASGSYVSEGGARAVMHAPIPYAAYGKGQLNGCGGFKSDLGFIFGSCKSFFDPCGPVPCGADGKALGGRLNGRLLGGSRLHPFGSPYNVGCTGCSYDSFLNK